VCSEMFSRRPIRRLERPDATRPSTSSSRNVSCSRLLLGLRLPTARGRGAASAILRAACAEARRQGALVAGLRTTEDLARADGFYQAVGFSSVGHERVWNVDDIDALDI